ncbi:MAG TPA: ribosome-associated translation inhibitor RaiA [Syntrophobacteraceae bacterium]|jgi:putative sigma-54 modulation protein|nr:ribosome-associated translation inhibitor RaiA [Syntrophobacteraceae bacterium]HBD08980.1 ribosome-associated translation inhibitor RaiA [Syntrophobacteraceae bacterium]HBZ54663.1 ribosome-associated translation inhibitor RaiA [Syntrophobacteraceae bacterium]
MQINLTFRNVEPAVSLREYTEAKIARVKKYVEEPVEAHVVLKVEKFRHIVEVSIDANGLRINGTEETDDMYSAIDMVVDKIEAQVRKYRDKLRRHKPAEGVKHLPVSMNVLASSELEEDQEPQVIKTEQFYAKPMDVDEAIMQLDLANNEFLVFTNSRTHRLNVLYRRQDGHYGLIEPL